MLGYRAIRGLFAALVAFAHIVTYAGSAYAQTPGAAPAGPAAQPPPQPAAQPVAQPAAQPVQSAGPSSDPNEPDAVVLKDGGIIRGRLTELRAGERAVVQLSSGQVATIRWDVIDHIERGGARVDENGNTAQAPSAPAAPPPGREGSVVVHMDVDEGLTLERQEGRGWAVVCSAPCDREIPLDGIYRVNGSGVRPSAPMSFTAKAGEHIVITADTASTGGFVGGIVMTSLGVPIFIIGSLVLLVVAAIDSANSGTDTSAGKAWGWGMFTVGAVSTVVGIILIVKNSRSTANQNIWNPPAQNGAGATPAAWRNFTNPELAPGAGVSNSGSAFAVPRAPAINLFETRF